MAENLHGYCREIARHVRVLAEHCRPARNEAVEDGHSSHKSTEWGSQGISLIGPGYVML